MATGKRRRISIPTMWPFVSMISYSVIVNVLAIIPMLTMGALPRAGAMAVPRRKQEAEGTQQRLDRTVMMKTDGRPLVVRQLVSAFRKNVDATTTVSASVTLARLAQVVKECHDRDTVDRKFTRMGKHVVIHFHRMGGEPAVLSMMAIAATREIGRTVQVFDDGVRSGTSKVTDRVDDPLFRVGHVIHTTYST